MTTDRRIAALVPLFDEAENVDLIVRPLAAALSRLPAARTEMIFVVDGVDGTRERLEELSREIPNMRIDHRPARRGFGRALADGVAMLGDDVDVVVTLDGDLNHDPNEIPNLLEALERENAGIVVGS